MTTPNKPDKFNLAKDPANPLLDRWDWNEPFDKEVFLNDANPSVFDPAKVVRASEPFDADEFIRYIHESRDDATVQCCPASG